MGLLFLLKVDILLFAVTTKLIHKTPFLFCGFRNFVFCIAGHRTAVLYKCDRRFTCIIVNSRSHVKELHRFVATGKERQRFIPRRASVIRVESDKSNPRIANFLVTHDKEDITSGLMTLLLGTTSDACVCLRRSIEAYYGIIYPIIVNKRADQGGLFHLAEWVGFAALRRGPVAALTAHRAVIHCRFVRIPHSIAKNAEEIVLNEMVYC